MILRGFPQTPYHLLELSVASSEETWPGLINDPFPYVHFILWLSRYSPIASSY